jgi:S-adenosylmethionine hydrolase
MESRQPIITLITDFGTTDGYVGAMKGVLLNTCPQASLVDITHSILPQDIYHAAFTLLNATLFFPPETIHLVVVDPGVGSARQGLAVRVDRMYYVAPDNGILSLVTRGRSVEAAVSLDNPDYHRSGGEVSSTFHGRDIFAPAAAHLAAGVPLDHLGSPVTDWVTLPFPSPYLRSPDVLVGEVLYLDHFGNAISNLGVLRWGDRKLNFAPPGDAEGLPSSLSCDAVIECRGHSLGLFRTYGDVQPGTPLAVIGSGGFLEIAVRDGSAGVDLGIRPGDQVVWQSK